MTQSYSKEFRKVVQEDCFNILNILENNFDGYQIQIDYFKSSIKDIRIEFKTLINSILLNYLETLRQEEKDRRELIGIQETKQKRIAGNIFFVESRKVYSEILISGFGTAIDFYFMLYLINKNLIKNNYKITENFLDNIPISNVNDLQVNIDIISPKISHKDENGKIHIYYIEFLHEKVFQKTSGSSCPISGKLNGIIINKLSREVFFSFFERSIYKKYNSVLEDYEKNLETIDIVKIPIVFAFLLGLVSFNKEHLDNNKEIFEKI